MTDESQHHEITESEPSAVRVTKSQLIRDVIVFQFKLFVDGIRDVILIPISLGAGVLSMLRAGDEAGSEFYEVVAFGRETERSINLFEAADRMQTGVNGGDIPELDNLVNGMEDYVREQVSQGQLDSVRKRLQGMLDSLEGKVRPAKKSEKPEKPETPE